MFFQKTFSGVHFNTSGYGSVSKNFERKPHDGDAATYRHSGECSVEVRRQIGGRSVQHRSVLNLWIGPNLTYNMTPTQAWAKAHLSRSHLPRVDNGVSVTPRAALVSSFEGKNGTASVDCENLLSLPLLSNQKVWRLDNCSTLQTKSPNFLASPDTEEVTLGDCPRQFESLEFMGQLPRLTKLLVSRDSSQEFKPSLHGTAVSKPVDFARCPQLQVAAFKNFTSVPWLTGLKGHAALRQLEIMGCSEPIEAWHLAAISTCKKLDYIDLTGSPVDSLFTRSDVYIQ
jgi:hypothetical protein